MTTTPSISSSFAKEWRVIDVIANIKCRQLTEDTFQLKSPSHVITVNREGFDLYRTNIDAFETWVDDHEIKAVEITDANREEFS